MMRTKPALARLGLAIASAIVALTTYAAGPTTGSDRGDTRREDDAARFDYLLHCSGCHRTDGSGSAPDVPSLRGPVGPLVSSPDGREYIARVPEVAQSPLDDDDLARLLNWMLRAFNADSLPPGFRPYDAREVGAARNRILADPIRARAEIVGDYRGTSSGDAMPAQRRRRDDHRQ